MAGLERWKLKFQPWKLKFYEVWHTGTGQAACVEWGLTWKSNSFKGLYIVIGKKHDRTKHINSFLLKNGPYEIAWGESPFSKVLPIQPSTAWRSCHMSKWLWAAHRKKCPGPSLCLHGQPESSVETSLGGSRSWLCYHRPQWARNSPG